MSDVSAEGAPQFRVGPDADPDRYVLGPAFSSGAEGILYRGTITTAAGLMLDVAIKMLQPRFLSRVDEWHARWAEQVELLRSLHVPGVVPVRDGFLGPLPHPPGQAGEGETLYLVMNWVEGESLDEWIRHRADRNPIDDLKVLVGVAAALDLMHSGRATGGVPIVHRDIKPANILVTEHGSVLVDFGLTRGLPDGQRLTGVAGTPGYLAPESTDDGRYSSASDRYAFGAVAYFVLTGSEPPVSHEPEAMEASLAAVPELNEWPEVAERVMAMLASEPDDRPLGLANWVGQLRRSSLDAGPDILNPAAPRRHPSGLRDVKRRRTGRQANRSNGPSKKGRGVAVGSRRWFITALVGGLIAVVASVALALTLLRGSTPSVIVINPVLPAQKQTITVTGSGFGNHAPFNGVRPCIELVDKSRGWSAGHAVPVGMRPGAGGACGAPQSDKEDAKDAVHLRVTKWTDSKIVISELTGGYNTVYEGKRCVLVPGDFVSVRVWNAASGAGPGSSSTRVRVAPSDTGHPASQD